jgi:membrane-associated phospholipid phosphatase
VSDIFISYAHEDRPPAAALARALETAGWSVWWDRKIQTGAVFDQEIEAALNDATLVIVLWSAQSVQSQWVRAEATNANEREVLVPVLVERGVRPPLAFTLIQTANLVGWDGSSAAAAFQDLVATIAQRLGPRVGPSPAPLGLLGPQLAGERRLVAAVRPQPSLLRTRAGLTGLVFVVFLANYVETLAETVLQRRYGAGAALGHQIADAFHGLEGRLSFESHDVTNLLAVYGYSAAYFFLLPALGLGLACVLWRRTAIDGYRILCLAIAGNYLVSLGFFLFFPVPERWAFPDSGAMLLSDRWSSSLIEVLRPISGLDNSFPSTHVSLTVVIVLVAYLARVRLRHTTLALGLTIILSTFVLGIHWIPDMLAGTAVGVLSVAAARRLTPLATRYEESMAPV